MTKTNSKAKLWLEVQYSPAKTDPESLATALDRLLETVLSTPGIMEEYGDPTFGPCWVAAEEQAGEQSATVRHVTSAAELFDWAESQGLPPEDLDDEIHDQVSAAASDLNNRGLSAQIEFLVGQFGVAETRKLLTEVVSDKPPRGTTP